MPATSDLGDSVQLGFTVKLKDPLTGAETLTNATVTLVVTKPDGSTTNPAITNLATGKYGATVAPDQPGEWLFKWAATGAATTAEDGAFQVDPNLAATLYATVGELRLSLGDETRLALDAGQLEQALRAASRAVDDHCQRPGGKFWLDPAVTARTYRTEDPWCAWVDDVGSSTGLLVKTDNDGDGTFETTWAASDYQLEPLNASTNGTAFAWWRLLAVGTQTFPYPTYPRARPTLQVTARHGWSQIPDPVRTATLLLAARYYRRKDAVFGSEFGGADFGPIRITRQDSDVTMLLEPYRIPTGYR